MIELSNGARVLAAYLTKTDHGDRAEGVVLAETASDFVTWRVWRIGEGAPLYDAETGHYFHKRGPMERGDDRQQAEIDFGQRLAMMISANAYEGLRQQVGDR